MNKAANKLYIDRWLDVKLTRPLHVPRDFFDHTIHTFIPWSCMHAPPHGRYGPMREQHGMKEGMEEWMNKSQDYLVDGGILVVSGSVYVRWRVSDLAGEHRS